jgi:hypothetical protein
MKNYIFILICSVVLLFLSGCQGLPDLPAIQVETPKGEKMGCTQDLDACTKTCEIVKDGYKAKTTTKLNPKVCQGI